MKILNRKEKDKNKENGKRTKILIGSIILCGILLTLSVSVFLYIKGRSSAGTSAMAPKRINDMGEEVITASGLTSIGMQEESYELDFLNTPLYVEETYLSSGEEVKQGTAFCKISEDTLLKAKEELTFAVTETNLLYRQGVLDYETEKLDAEATLKQSDISEKYAQAEYDSAASQALKTVQDLEEKVKAAEELLQEYNDSVNNNYYETYYHVQELEDTYYEHFTYLMELYEEWNIEKLNDLYGSSVTSLSQSSSTSSSSANDSKEAASGQTGGSGTGQGGAPGGGQGASSGDSGEAGKLSVYNYFDELVQEEATSYKEAKEQYEAARSKAAAGLDKAASDLSDLKAQLALAQTEYEKELINCQTDYQVTLSENQNAQTVYDTQLQKLEETLSELQNNKEEAEENLQLFEDTIGDGYFYTQSAGTIVMNNVREKSYLSGETILVAYSNPEKVTVAASVDQSNIADISVGDSAYVVINGYGNYTGTVNAINPVTQAQSRTSVTYQVTIELTGDLGTLDANLTSYVYFGMTEELIQKMEDSTGEK